MSSISFLRKLMVAVAVAAVLTACSSSKKGGNFTTKGLRPPEASCKVKPSRIGLAEKIRNINEHNGCEVPNAWKVEQLGSVAFSQPAVMNCGMADPLHTWLEDVVQPTAQRELRRKHHQHRRGRLLCLPPAQQQERRQDERARFRQCHRHRCLHARKRPQGDGGGRAGGGVPTSAASSAPCMTVPAANFIPFLAPIPTVPTATTSTLHLQNRESGSVYCR